jgi:hypothetical protein
MADNDSKTDESKIVHNIKLFYEPIDGVDHVRADDVDTMHIRVGDELHFESDAGDVHVLMIPAAMFSAEEFRTGDKPLVVNASAAFKFCCGLKSGSTVIGYPEHQRFGHNVDTPPADRGTTCPPAN